MRRRAKASSAGPTEAKGPRARRSDGLAFLLALAILAACLLPASALAARSQIDTFGPDGTEATQFGHPGAIGVDQGTHDLYVADYGSGTVEKFDENHTPANFSALGSNEIGGFSFFSGEALEEIAVDSTSHGFYVADFGNGVIKGFQQDGEPREFTAGPGAGTNKIPGFSEPCGVAVDANGDIYVADYGTGVHVFSPDGEEITHFPAFEACNLAVDTAGNVYVSPYAFGTPGIKRFTPSEFPVTSSTTYSSASVGGANAAFALAVDPSTGELYADLGNRVVVFDGSGAFRYEFGGPLASSEGIAVDGTTGKAYASDGSSSMVRVYGPATEPPGVTTGSASDVKAEAATLSGIVNPKGQALTECFFEYGTTSSYGETAPCAPDAASIPADTGGHAVSAEISGLAPETPYHFRLVVANAEGAPKGLDRTFTTLGPPTISAQSVEAVTASDATVSAKINPGGTPTTYHVEYGTTTAYGHSTAESAAIGFSDPTGFSGDYSQHAVSVHVSGLAPATAYHFRFVATSAVASVPGSDATFATYGGSPSFAPCANDALRTGTGALLPDCRAYEQVSPAEKLGSGILSGPGVVLTNADGSRVSFASNSGLPTTGGTASATGPSFFAARGINGWSTDGILPLADPGVTAEVMGWGADLSTSASYLPNGAGAGIYFRDSSTGAQQRLISGQELLSGRFDLAGFAAEDGADMIFESTKALPGTDAIAGKENLYELDHGALTLAGRVPLFPATSCDDAAASACVPAPNGAFARAYEWDSGELSSRRVQISNPISAKGSKVFFTEAGTGRVYLREAGVRTRQVSASQRTPADPNGEKAAALIEASPSGATAFFLSCEKLTDDSTAVSTSGENTCSDITEQGQDLYAYDTDSGQLTDLTVDPNSNPFGAQVVGVVGSSADGSDVYFVANGVLAPGASPGNCDLSSSPLGQCSLYLVHRPPGGSPTITFVTRLAAATNGDQLDWLPQVVGPRRTARVSAAGTVLFSSTRQLTSYDNHGVQEFYRFDPGSGLACVSCNPTGMAPVDRASLQSDAFTVLALAANPGIPTRNISANGDRIFFESPDKLVAADVNGELSCPLLNARTAFIPACTDVYEWEAAGAGTCSQASPAFSTQDNGCLYLLSSGASGGPSFFGDADAEGDNAFFFTEQPLVSQDKDHLYDAYDARVEGGLPSQHQGAAACSGEGCRGPVGTAPTQSSAASATLAGTGNQKRQHKKHAKKKHKAKKHKKQKRKSAAKRAGRHHGGAK